MDTRLIFRDCRDVRETEGGTQPVSPGEQWLQAGTKGGPDREIRPAVRQEKPLRRAAATVPQTDTGGRDEYSKALG